jgi:hypothetical protein
MPRKKLPTNVSETVSLSKRLFSDQRWAEMELEAAMEGPYSSSRFVSSGNVSMACTSPSAKLYVKGVSKGRDMTPEENEAFLNTRYVPYWEVVGVTPRDEDAT